MFDLHAQFYQPEGAERVGFILKDSKVIECVNIALDSEYVFMIQSQDIFLAVTQGVASWHTHPGRPSQFSPEDALAFANYPDMVHYILGDDGVSAYKVEDNGDIRKISCEEADHLVRMAQEAAPGGY